MAGRPDSQIRTSDHPAYTDRVHRLLICALAIVASCYRPRIEGACEVRCDPANAPVCPAGLACGADGLCFDEAECSSLGTDGGTDGSIDVAGDFCAGTGWLATTCPSVIGPPLNLPPTINTQTDCSQVISGYCLIAAEQIAVVGAVQVTGPRPLVLFAQTNIIVATSSIIEAASGNGVGCPTIAFGASANTAAGATGGGPGGTLGGRGGSGGGADNTVHAMAPVAFAVTSLRGGCPGGSGGGGPSGGGGVGGSGGGAIYLIAGDVISIIGTIRAAGGGGGGGVPPTGTSAAGGGGGSGGLIALDAPMIQVRPSGVLFAEGGGGGGGARGGNGSSGAPAVLLGVRAGGGLGLGAASTAGAQGSGLGSLAGDSALDATTSGGAGGGGGGAGVIKLFGMSTFDAGSTLSPPPT